ncbi:hypothetical protein [Maribacter sp. 2210JD10-5]|uniref:hypothetical protein n=1 Tax=Maribacter sp. 2210JD10-5 TaxID=3386272 RepID=UPI0039BD5843
MTKESRKRKNRTRIGKLLSESALIVFSVLLALFISEWRNDYNENKQTQVIIKNIREEISENQKFLETYIPYHEQVKKRINQAYVQDSLETTFFSDKSFDISNVAPNGILQDRLNNIVWTVAKADKITNRIPLQESKILYEIYDQQNTVNKTVERIIAFLSSREIHRKESLDESVIVLRTLFNELVGQEKYLNYQYENALKELKN